MTEYYVSGCTDNGSEIEACGDSVATFWTLYVRDSQGLSQGIIDCKFREDAEAAMKVYAERDALQQQVNALAAENVELNKRVLPTLRGLPALATEAVIREIQARAVEGFDSQRDEVDELSMQIRRLVHALKISNPDNGLLKSVPDYMKRKGYWKITDCLRAGDKS